MGAQPKGISGSRAAAVLGLSEYQSPFSVWQRLCEERRPGFNASRGYLLPEDPENASIRFGLAFEDAIATLVERKTGLVISDREREYAEDFNTCHVDGIFSDNAMYEAKTTTLFSFWEGWGEAGTDRVPQSYQIQAQNNMRLCKAPFTRLFVLCWPIRPDEWEAAGILPADIDTMDWATVLDQMGLLKEYRIEASPVLQGLIFDRLTHFWHTYVLPEREPEIDRYKDLQRAFPEPVGTIVVTEQEERWLVERKMITEEIGASGRLGKRKEELKVLTLKSICARLKQDAVIDNESTEKVVFRNAKGDKLGSYDGKTFR
jgi:hypothetical protein